MVIRSTLASLIPKDNLGLTAVVSKLLAKGRAGVFVRVTDGKHPKPGRSVVFRVTGFNAFARKTLMKYWLEPIAPGAMGRKVR